MKITVFYAFTLMSFWLTSPVNLQAQGFNTGLIAGYKTGLVPFLGQVSLGLALLMGKTIPGIFGIDYDHRDSLTNGMIIGHAAGFASYIATLAIARKQLGKRWCAVASFALPALVMGLNAALDTETNK